MLEQQAEPEQNLPAASARITPDELRRTVANIEARRAEAARLAEIEAQRQANTVPIGEAVQELALDIAPEEIWAEVQTERAQAPPPHRPLAESLTETSETGRPLRLRPLPDREMTETQDEVRSVPAVVFCALMLVVLLGVVNLAGRRQNLPMPPFGGAMQTVTQTRSVQQSLGQSAPLDAEFYDKLEMTRGPHPKYRLTTFRGSFVPPAFQGQPLYPVNAIPDGYELHGDFAQNTFVPSPNMAAFLASDETKSPWYPWTFVRYNGCWYRRGWISSSDKTNVLKHKRFFLLPNVNPPQPRYANDIYLPLTVPSNFAESGGQDVGNNKYVWIEFSKDNKLDLDKHAWETETVPGKTVNETPQWSGRGLYQTPETYYFRADFDASSVLQPLLFIPNKREIVCSNGTLEAIDEAAHGITTGMYLPFKEVGAILVDVRPKLRKDWTIIKYGGKVYLRGWIANRLNEKKLVGRYINVYNSSSAPELGLTPTQVTVNVEQTRMSNSRIFVSLSNVQLDKHAWEKW